YQVLLEFANTVLMICNAQKIMYANPAGARMLGFADPILVNGKSVQDIIHPNYQKTIQHRLQAILKKEEKVNFVREKFSKIDGQVIDIIGYSIPFFFNGQKTLYLALHDITKNHQQEKSSRHKESLLQKVVNLVPHMIFAKNQFCDFILGNQEFAKNYGTTVDKILHSDLDQFSGFNHQFEKFWEKDLAVLEGRKPEFTTTENFIDVYMRHCEDYWESGHIGDTEEILSYVIWDQKYLVDVSLINIQHKELFRHVNQLLEAIHEGKVESEIEIVFQFLENYTITHFTEEEELMLEYGDPKYSNHKKEHTLFIKELDNLKKEKYKNGNKLHLVLRVQSQIVDWLLNHITKVDTELANFLKSNQKYS
ncbi:MAG: hemerythrin, partial [bacterium]